MKTIFHFFKFHRFILRHTKYSIRLFTILYGACISLTNAQQNIGSLNNLGSFLGVTGQILTSNNGNLDSTDAISTGDKVEWTNYFQSKLNSPYKSVGILTLPPNFKWIRGSVKLPPVATLEYKLKGSTNFVSTEPKNGDIVTEVKWTINPILTIDLKSTVNSVVNFKGTGDGYRVIPYKENLYVVNHHIGGNYLNCRNVFDDKITCLGFPDINLKTGGLAIPSKKGQKAAQGIDPNFLTPYRSIEHLDQNTGNLYIYGADQNTWKISVRCINLNDLTACIDEVNMATNKMLTINPNIDKNTAVNPIGSIGTKYYAIVASLETDQGNSPILCFDTATNKPCKGQPYDIQLGFHHSWEPSYIDGANIYLGAETKNSDRLQILHCFDTTKNKVCPGWNINNSKDLIVKSSIFPYLNKNGSFKGICTIHDNQCIDTKKNPFTPSSNYTNFLENNGFFQTVKNSARIGHGSISNITVIGPRLFSSSSVTENNNYASCFDFSKNSQCFADINSSEGQPRTYAIIKDPIRTDCMWSLGDAAMAKAFNPKTGLDCPNVINLPPKINLDVTPTDYYKCNNSKLKIDSWDKIRFSPTLKWGAGGIKNLSVRILNKDTKKELLVTSFPQGEYTLDISNTIKYSDNRNLTVELQAELDVTDQNTASTLKQEVGFDVTWKGEPVQLCFQTSAPNLNSCRLEVTVKQENTEIDSNTNNANTPVLPDEVLNAKTNLTPGSTDKGTGPNVATTTLRQYPKGSSDPTQLMQTWFDLKSFTGGLNQYELDTTGISTAPIFKNQGLGNGIVFTSKFSNSNSLVDMVNIPYIFQQLSNNQKTSINKNMNGIIDNKGVLRHNYMVGDRTNEIPKGIFRKRNNVLGPVLNSSPVTLLNRSSIAYNDSQYPGYNLFKQTINRTNTMVFYQGNDGFLRAYDVIKPSSSQKTGLTVKFSFIPGSLFLGPVSKYTDSQLSELREDPFLLDSTPLISDVHLGDSKNESNQWKTVLVGNQGRGGSLVYALDVTSGSLDNLLFEYTANSHTELKDLGKVVSPQFNDKVSGADQIVRLTNNRWAYIMGNGINSHEVSGSATGTAVLYLFYLNANKKTATKDKWLAIPVPFIDKNDPVLSKNGLNTPRPVDINGDGNIELIYAGDIQGNLWRFDVSDLSKIKVTKLFKTANGEPIYTAPLVTPLPSADKLCIPKINNLPDLTQCWLVSFGTGDLIDVLGGTTDTITGIKSNNNTQSLYSIYDAGDGRLVNHSQLVSKEIINNANNTRSIPNTVIEYGSGANGIRGWRLQLSPGERLTTNPILPSSGNMALFATGRPLGYQDTQVNGTCYPSQAWLTTINLGAGVGENSLKDNSGNLTASLPINEAPILGSININPNASRSSNTSTLITRGDNIINNNNTPSSISLVLPTIQGRISWREVFDLPK